MLHTELFDKLSDAVEVVSLKGKLVYTNQAFYNIFCSQSGLISEAVQRGNLNLEKQIEELSLAPSYSFEREVRLDSENALLLETNCSKIDIDGEPHIIRVSKVIKKGVIEEEVKLMQSNKDYTTFFNAIDDFMLVVGFDGRVIDTNDAVEKYLGYSRKELRSIHLKTLFEERRVEEIREVVNNIKKQGKRYIPPRFLRKTEKGLF